LYSQQFDDGYWSKDALTVDPNSTTAPDGTTTADKLTATGADSFSQSTAITSVSGQTYTFSVYLKADTPTTLALYCLNPVTAQSVNVTTEWQRFSITVAVNSTTVRWQIGGGGTFTTGEVIYAWGAQVELGSVATSPIYTVASTVARTADVVSLTGASSLIGQTEGTIYLEVDWQYVAGNQFLIDINADPATTDNRVAIYVSSGDEIFFNINADGVVATNTGVTSAGFTGVLKLAFAYAHNDCALYKDGASISTDATVDFSAIATLAQIFLGQTLSGNQQANMWIRSVALFPTRLSNAQLASLTTL
jgi:hypothetical protein